MTDSTANEPGNIAAMQADERLKRLRADLYRLMIAYKYSYNFTWLGRPIIQLPQDIVAMQELLWRVKPDLIVETGIAQGGSLIFYGSMLDLISDEGEVLGIDVEIRCHNRREIEQHPVFKRIRMIEGSAIDSHVVNKVFEIAEHKNTVMVVLDSHHTHDHVFKELELYSPLVRPGSYVVVFDTLIEDVAELRKSGSGHNTYLET